ncbi:hypothetical protein FBUS_09901 [Fasciolopsis buskii]|uniref:Uncharacterized protein n=1 Tax=Fasciolopsis buskii TaxID=27845 RepID=A0A8E0VEU3_9TREM|nr:hypothetical protein FBUS_09901 [Fasciolopsis buski]
MSLQKTPREETKATKGPATTTFDSQEETNKTASDPPTLPCKIEYKLNSLLDFDKPDPNTPIPKDWITLNRRGCIIYSTSSELQEMVFSHFLLVLNMTVQLQLAARKDESLTNKSNAVKLDFILLGENRSQMAWSNLDGSVTPRDKFKRQLVQKNQDSGFLFSPKARPLYLAYIHLFTFPEFCTLKDDQLPLDELIELFTRDVQEDDGKPDSLWNALERSGIDENFQLTGVNQMYLYVTNVSMLTAKQQSY